MFIVYNDAIFMVAIVIVYNVVSMFSLYSLYTMSSLWIWLVPTLYPLYTITVAIFIVYNVVSIDIVGSKFLESRLYSQCWFQISGNSSLYVLYTVYSDVYNDYRDDFPESRFYM